MRQRLADVMSALRASEQPQLLTHARSHHPVACANRAFLDVFGWTEAELRGQTWRVLHNPHTSAGVIDRLDGAMRTKQPARVSVMLSGKRGIALPCDVSVEPVYDDAGGAVTHNLHTFRVPMTTLADQEVGIHASLRGGDPLAANSMLSDELERMLGAGGAGACGAAAAAAAAAAARGGGGGGSGGGMGAAGGSGLGGHSASALPAGRFGMFGALSAPQLGAAAHSMLHQHGGQMSVSALRGAARGGGGLGGVSRGFVSPATSGAPSTSGAGAGGQSSVIGTPMLTQASMLGTRCGARGGAPSTSAPSAEHSHHSADAALGVPRLATSESGGGGGGPSMSAADRGGGGGARDHTHPLTAMDLAAYAAAAASSSEAGGSGRGGGGSDGGAGLRWPPPGGRAGAQPGGGLQAESGLGRALLHVQQMGRGARLPPNSASAAAAAAAAAQAADAQLEHERDAYAAHVVQQHAAQQQQQQQAHWEQAAAQQQQWEAAHAQQQQQQQAVAAAAAQQQAQQLAAAAGGGGAQPPRRPFQLVINVDGSVFRVPITLDAALEPSSDLVLVLEGQPPHRLVHANVAWTRTFGWPLEQAIGRTLSLMHGHGTSAEALTKLELALDQGAQLTVQLLCYTHENQPMMTQLCLSPLLPPGVRALRDGQRPWHYVAICKPTPLDARGAERALAELVGTGGAGEGGGADVEIGEGGEGCGTATVESATGGADADIKPRVAPFISKLHKILFAPDTDDVVHWSPDGHSFIITDVHRFEAEVLPRYFRHNRFSSFSQQLHTYNFTHKAKSSCLDVCLEYSHEHFTPNSRDRLHLIKRGGGALSLGAGAHSGVVGPGSTAGSVPCGGGSASGRGTKRARSDALELAQVQEIIGAHKTRIRNIDRQFSMAHKSIRMLMLQICEKLVGRCFAMTNGHVEGTQYETLVSALRHMHSEVAPSTLLLPDGSKGGAGGPPEPEHAGGTPPVMATATPIELGRGNRAAATGHPVHAGGAAFAEGYVLSAQGEDVKPSISALESVL